MADEKRKISIRQKCKNIVRQNLLVILTLVGVAVGFIVGFAVSPTQPTSSTLMWLGMPGELYIRMLKMMIVPLVVCSVISGMPGELYIRMLKMMIVPLVVCSVISGTAAMNPRSNGKISGVSLSYIMIGNLIPSIIGTLLCAIVRPGEGIDSKVEPSEFGKDVMETDDIFADLLRNIVPDNLVAASFRQAQTKYKYNETILLRSNGTHNVTEIVRDVAKISVGIASSTNILGLIIVSAMFGVTTNALKEKGKPFLDFFLSSTDIIIKLLRILIWTTPIGVASLCAKTIASTEDVDATFRKLGLYFATVMITLLAWGLIAMPLLFYFVRRTNPFRFLATIIPPMMIVFATGSSVIALPECLYALEYKNNIDKRITRCVTPLAATIGRSGGTIYISISCIFIMQIVGIDINASSVILVILLTWISALAIPPVSGASLITVLILLTTLGIPGESAAMLFALEFFVDRSRSVVNLIGQLTGVVVTHRFCAAGLPLLKEDDHSDGYAARSDTTISSVNDNDLKDSQALKLASIDLETGIHILPH